jgi:hypothetical protein
MGEQQDVICPVSRDRDEVGCVCPAAQPAVVSTVPPRNRARAWIGHMVAGSSIVVMVLAPATMETAQRRSRPRVSGRLRRTATTRNAIMVAYGAARHLPARAVGVDRRRSYGEHGRTLPTGVCSVDLAWDLTITKSVRRLPRDPRALQVWLSAPVYARDPSRCRVVDGYMS